MRYNLKRILFFGHSRKWVFFSAAFIYSTSLALATLVLIASMMAVSLHVDMRHWTIRARDITLSHIPGLPKGSVIEIPSLYVEWDPSRLLKGELRLREMDIHIGTLNLQESSVAPSHKQPRPFLPIFKTVIDTLNIKVDRVTIQSEGLVTEKDMRDVDVDFKETYRHVESYGQVKKDIAEKTRRRVIESATKYVDPFGILNLLATFTGFLIWV